MPEVVLLRALLHGSAQPQPAWGLFLLLALPNRVPALTQYSGSLAPEIVCVTATTLTRTGPTIWF